MSDTTREIAAQLRGAAIALPSGDLSDLLLRASLVLVRETDRVAELEQEVKRDTVAMPGVSAHRDALLQENSMSSAAAVAEVEGVILTVGISEANATRVVFESVTDGRHRPSTIFFPHDAYESVMNVVKRGEHVTFAIFEGLKR